jgi:hypothetical protein
VAAVLLSPMDMHVVFLVLTHVTCSCVVFVVVFFLLRMCVCAIASLSVR